MRSLSAVTLTLILVVGLGCKSGASPPSSEELKEARATWDAALASWRQRLDAAGDAVHAAAPSAGQSVDEMRAGLARMEAANARHTALLEEANQDLLRVLNGHRVLAHAARCAAREIGGPLDQINWAGGGRFKLSGMLTELEAILELDVHLDDPSCPPPEEWPR